MVHVIEVAAKEIGERFPLGLPVKDRDGRTGVVVGYGGPKVLVQETGICCGGRSDLPTPVR